VPGLTQRQRQALCLVTLTNREIGMRLGISWRTVRNLLTDAYVRLDVSDGTQVGKRTPALLLALSQGIVTLDEIELPPPLGWCWERVEQVRAAARRESENVLTNSA